MKPFKSVETIHGHPNLAAYRSPKRLSSQSKNPCGFCDVVSARTGRTCFDGSTVIVGVGVLIRVAAGVGGLVGILVEILVGRRVGTGVEVGGVTTS